MYNKITFFILGLLLTFTSIQAQSINEMQKILASDGAVDDWFGYSISISGNYAVIGAGADDDNGTESGSAYVFFNNNGIWEQQTKLTASDGASDDIFGISVGISGRDAQLARPC